MKSIKTMMTAAATLMAVGMLTSSCRWDLGSGGLRDDSPKVTDVRSLTGFEAIEVNGSPRVCYTQADSFSVTVTGHQKSVEDILTEVKGKALTVRNRGKIGVVNINLTDQDDQLTVWVTSPDLTGIRLNGSGDFVSREQIDTDNIEVVLRGSGDIRVSDMICDHCQVELIGSGDINMEHLDAKTVTASLVGSGDLDLNLNNVETTRLSLKGSGDVEATFSGNCQEVDCDLRGSGDIELKGQVGHLSQHTSGSGDIDTKRLTIGR